MVDDHRNQFYYNYNLYCDNEYAFYRYLYSYEKCTYTRINSV